MRHPTLSRLSVLMHGIEAPTSLLCTMINSILDITLISDVLIARTSRQAVACSQHCGAHHCPECEQLWLLPDSCSEAKVGPSADVSTASDKQPWRVPAVLTHKVSRPSRKRHLGIWWPGGFLPKQAGVLSGSSDAPTNGIRPITKTQILAVLQCESQPLWATDLPAARAWIQCSRTNALLCLRSALLSRACDSCPASASIPPAASSTFEYPGSAIDSHVTLSVDTKSDPAPPASNGLGRRLTRRGE